MDYDKEILEVCHTMDAYYERQLGPERREELRQLMISTDLHKLRREDTQWPGGGPSYMLPVEITGYLSSLLGFRFGN